MHSRRRVLVLGGAAVTATAGCFGGSDDDNGNSSNDSGGNTTNGSNESANGDSDPTAEKPPIGEGTTPDLTLEVAYNRFPAPVFRRSVPFIRIIVREGESVSADRIRFEGDHIEENEQTWAEIQETDTVERGSSLTIGVDPANAENFRLDIDWLAEDGSVAGVIDRITAPGTGEHAIAPEPAFEFDLDTDAAELAVTLSAGDPIPAEQLSFTGRDLVNSGSSWGEVIGDRGATVTPGDSVTLALENRYSAIVTVLWRSEDATRRASLARHSGPGQPETDFTFEYDDAAGEVTVRVTGGDPLTAGKVVFDGTDLTGGRQSWGDLTGDPDARLSEGASVTIPTDSRAYLLRVNWVPQGREPREITTSPGPQYVEPPESSFGFDYDAATSELTVELAAGDSFQAGRVSFGGTLVGDAGQTWGELIGDETATVEVGDTVTVGVESDAFSLELVWTNDPGTQSRMLAQTDGPDAPPEVGFLYDYTPEESELVAVPVEGSDEFDARQVTIRGEGFAETGDSWLDQADLPDGETTASPGDGVTLTDVSEDFFVEIVWASEDGQRSTTLDSQSGPEYEAPDS